VTEDAHEAAPEPADLREPDGLWQFGVAASEAMTARVQELYQALPSGPARRGGDLDGELRRLRIDLERAADVSLDLFDRVLALVRRLDSAAPTGDPAEREVLVIRVPAGERGASGLWAHNTSDSTQAPPELRCSPLADFDGARIPDSCVSVEGTAQPIEANNSRRLELVVDVPKNTPPGSYHGLLLTRGDAQGTFPVRVEVS
jgi:hypothetical protein